MVLELIYIKILKEKIRGKKGENKNTR